MNFDRTETPELENRISKKRFLRVKIVDGDNEIMETGRVKDVKICAKGKHIMMGYCKKFQNELRQAV